MKDHEIIAKIGALLDGADAPTRASVEAWLRARLGAPAPAVTLAPALSKPAQPSVVPLPLVIPYQPTAPGPSPMGMPWWTHRHGMPWWANETICDATAENARSTSTLAFGDPRGTYADKSGTYADGQRHATLADLKLSFGIEPLSAEETAATIESALATVSKSWPEDAKAAVVETAARLLTGDRTLFAIDDNGIRIEAPSIGLPS